MPWLRHERTFVAWAGRRRIAARSGLRCGEWREVLALDLGWPCWVGVVAEDLDVQRRFYHDVLGLSELAAGPGWVQFDFGQSGMLELVQRSGDPSMIMPATRSDTRSRTSNPHATLSSPGACGRSPGSKGTLRLAVAGATSATPRATSSRSRNAARSIRVEARKQRHMPRLQPRHGPRPSAALAEL
jgi:catechol 2,3-dioxygenase-like lactoylglutathione lyase family enzyme